jgi:hypothetical protein
VPLTWDVADEEEEEEEHDSPYKNAIKLSFFRDDEWREMIIGKGHTMRSFMSDNWEEIEWGEFRFQGKPLDSDTPLLSLTDEQLEIKVEVRTQTDRDQEREYEEERAQWKALEDGVQSADERLDGLSENPLGNIGSSTDETREPGSLVDSEGDPAEIREERIELQHQSRGTRAADERTFLEHVSSSNIVNGGGNPGGDGVGQEDHRNMGVNVPPTSDKLKEQSSLHKNDCLGERVPTDDGELAGESEQNSKHNAESQSGGSIDRSSP